MIRKPRQRTKVFERFLMIASVLVLSGTVRSAEPAPKRFPAAEMTFPDQKLGQKFRRFLAACESFSQPGWHHRPFQAFDSFQARGVFFAEWANVADKNGRNPINYSGPDEMHCLAMSAYFDADSPDPASRQKIVGLGLNATWNPPGTGWRTAVDYYTMHGRKYPRSGQPMEKYEILWNYHPATGEAFKPGLRWSHSGTQFYSHHFTFGGKSGREDDHATLYEISVSHEPVGVTLATLDADVCRTLESPESLRDQLLTSNQQLLSKLKSEIPAGRSVRKALRSDRLSPPDNSPEDYSRSSRPLTSAEQDEIAAAAVAEIQIRIDVIQRDFKALHESANRTFPLRQCLNVAAKLDR